MSRQTRREFFKTAGLAGVGYTADARLEDILVRDGDLDTPGFAEPFLQVFSAGNSGPGSATVGATRT